MNGIYWSCTKPASLFPTQKNNALPGCFALSSLQETRNIKLRDEQRMRGTEILITLWQLLWIRITDDSHLRWRTRKHRQRQPLSITQRYLYGEAHTKLLSPAILGFRVTDSNRNVVCSSLEYHAFSYYISTKYVSQLAFESNVWRFWCRLVIDHLNRGHRALGLLSVVPRVWIAADAVAVSKASMSCPSCPSSEFFLSSNRSHRPSLQLVSKLKNNEIKRNCSKV